MTLQDHIQAIADQDVGTTYFNASLAGHSSWCIGGPADLLIEPDNVAQVARVVRVTGELGVPLVVIGQGSNLLFDDAGLRGVVMKIGRNMSAITIDGCRISVEAGAWVPQLARRAMQAGLRGLEHIIGIPGTVGGLVLMNGGSHRRGIGENVISVSLVDRNGNIVTRSADECDFSYRHSALQGSGAVVVGVELECETAAPRQIRREMLADLRERRRKFPRKLPNCGSVFLSTEQMHATVGPPGRIIEEAGLKGARIGQAEVSHQHANFIVNTGGATSGEVLDLVRHVRQVVLAQTGFELRCEVRYVRPQDGTILPADEVI